MNIFPEDPTQYPSCFRGTWTTTGPVLQDRKIRSTEILNTTFDNLSLLVTLNDRSVWWLRVLNGTQIWKELEIPNSAVIIGPQPTPEEVAPDNRVYTNDVNAAPKETWAPEFR